MTLTVYLFAGARDRAGAATLVVDLPGSATVADLRVALARACPALAPLLPACRVAVAAAYADDADPIPPEAEVALIPPVSGGSAEDPGEAPRTIIAITADPIDHHAVVDSVLSSRAGAVASFLGTVRELTGDRRTATLDYEAYPAMAEATLRDLAAETRRRWPVVHLAVVHRVGHLDLGEVCVVVAVSCPHRGAAFDACRWLIDTLKEVVPIWKKETWGDGTSEWVHPGGEAPA